MTEQCEAVTDLPAFALLQTHIWVTHDPTSLLNTMRDTYGEMLRYTFTGSRDPLIPVTMQDARLASFSFDKESIVGRAFGKQPQHTVWQPSRMFSTPRLAADLIGNDHMELLTFAMDVREWCEENNLPLKSTLPGLASSLLRDKRFWPNPRGRVPRATNERIRKFLPGVYQERRAPRARIFKAAVSLDQERAYHHAAQEIPMPDPTNLYARGFYNDPENAPIWAAVGSEVYLRTITQPGLLALIASSKPAKKDEWRPPVCEEIKRKVRYVWANELDHCIEHGLNVEGLVAAWTSETQDWGLAEYGLWSEAQITYSSDYRKHWLKPTLHALYGLLGARPRDILIGRSHGRGNPEIYTMRGFSYSVMESVVKDSSPITVNVATLGVLQSTIRQRTLDLANEYGDRVLHVHADGLHLDATQLSFIPHGWSVESVSNLFYLDDVSWTSDQRDVLPGRDQWQKAQLKERLNRDHANAQNRTSKRARKGRQNRAA